MKKLSERIMELEKMGVDTSKFNLALTGIAITPVAQMVVEDKQVDNKKLFRRWVAAQTFRMIYEKSYNATTRSWETGWDNYLRNCYDYKYQFSMMLEEFRVLNKLAIKDEDEFYERAHFFNRDVAVATCEHYMDQFDKYVKEHTKDGKVKLANYGTVDMTDYRRICVDLRLIISDLKNSNTYAELYTYLKKFMKKMNKLPFETPKCPEWKNTFKGNGAYYTLKNLIMFHGCTLRYHNKAESLETLKTCLETYRGEYWRFHYMLLDTIEHNNFDLRASIERNR